MSKREIYRILDVAANRGREALRVVEDAARFLDDNEELTRALKSARHRFAVASEKLDRRERMLARDTNADVGTTLETEDEYERATLLDVLTANFARLQESARSLEEFSKIVEPRLAREWERLRYDSYTLEKLAYAAATRHEFSETQENGNVASNEKSRDAREEDARFNEIEKEEESTTISSRHNEAFKTDLTEQPSQVFFPFSGAPARSPREARRARLRRSKLGFFFNRVANENEIDELLKTPIDIFQICVDLASDSSRASSETFIKRFVDLYLTDELPITKRPLAISRGFSLWGDAFDGGVVEDDTWRSVREQIGPDYLLGVAVSNLDSALEAFQGAREGVVDFIELGPVFTNETGREGTGTAFLRAVLETVEGDPCVPIFAFGGVDRNNCVDVFDSGVERVCVGSAVWNAQDRAASVKFLRSLF